jgi:hypothetical protein
LNSGGPRPSVVVLAGLLLGLILGAGYTWFFVPAPVTAITPAGLGAGQKERYRALVALAYAANGDRTRADTRLQALQDDRLPAVLDAQAQNAVQGGQEAEAQALAGLAAALRTPNAVSAAPTSAQPALVFTLAPTLRAATPSPLPPFLPKASATPPATRGMAFTLSSSDPVCDPALPEGLLQVYVVDAAGGQAPGVRVSVTWEGGQTDVFYTGLAADMGPGYADFRMSPQVEYALSVGDAGAPTGGLMAPVCERADGSTYMGGIRTRFRP